MKLEFKGTKGSWEVSGLINKNGSLDKTLVLTDKGAYTPNAVQKTYSSIQELGANAKLIAAAPELLEACIEAEKHHKGGHSEIGWKLRKAIEKALK